MNAIGAGLIGYLEDWTQIDVIYYAVITATTIGYGKPSLPPSLSPSAVITSHWHWLR